MILYDQLYLYVNALQSIAMLPFRTSVLDIEAAIGCFTDTCLGTLGSHLSKTDSTHVGNSEKSSWLWIEPSLAVAPIWGMDQQMKDLFLSFSLYKSFR